jgi:class 3 adenylate cyclase
MGSPEPPAGYLFADIEGSTERWERAPAQMRVAVARLDSLIEEAVARNSGVIQDRSGDGVFALFTSGNPLQGALEMQLEMQRTDWSAIGGLDLRIGVHAGASGGADQVDRAVANRGARIMASGWGGQIVASREATRMYETPEGGELIDLGLCRFKGVRDAMLLASLVHPSLLRAEFPPLRSLLFDGAGADVLNSPIFGRQKELGDVLARLGGTRLLTIVGPGGNGKTRLALQVGAEVTARQPVCFASLDAASRDADLPSTLAAALRLRLVAGRGGEEQLIDYLRDKQMLLVLDNAETIAGRAALVGQIVAACRRLTVLVTSREPLIVENEVIVHLQGIDLLDSRGQLSVRLCRSVDLPRRRSRKNRL